MRRLFAGAAAILLAGAAHALTDAYVWPLPAWMPPPPVPADNPMSAGKVELGRHLFYDARLSADGTVACASCHLQARAFSDGRETAMGIGGTVDGKDAPSLANAGYLPVLTWANPHMTSLESQALVPLFESAALAAEPVVVFATTFSPEVVAFLQAAAERRLLFLRQQREPVHGLNVMVEASQRGRGGESQRRTRHAGSPVEASRGRGFLRTPAGTRHQFSTREVGVLRPEMVPE